MTITTTEDKNIQDYPKAMKFIPKEGDTYTNFIVYFEHEREGFVIAPGDSNYKFGDTSDRWAMDQFEDFHGKIVLKF